MALGSILALTNATLNRIMVVELSLLAIVPGMLIALHYAIQITRPNWGLLSDIGGNRTRWIIGGLSILGIGATLATVGIIVFEKNFSLGLFISSIAYGLIGIGVGASGTSLLALLATGTQEKQRALAATITWLMMIMGAILTAFIVGDLLEPYSHLRLLVIVINLSIIVTIVSAISLWGIEKKAFTLSPPSTSTKSLYRRAILEILAEPLTRLFTIFVFVAMTAYYMQDLILEPYAGLIFDFSVNHLKHCSF